MFTRKSASLVTSYNNLNFIASRSCESSTSFNGRKRSTRAQRCGRERCSRYATIADGSDNHHESHENERHTWPKPPAGQPHPSPYQIFAMKTNAVYSKTRYYELVKLYHPDRVNHSSSDAIPHSIKLERYRLIVTAHAILSDPTKRSAYDRFGAGWNGRADVGARHGRSGAGSHAAGPFSRSWNDPADPIWQNATWEDWERFYEWKARQEGSPSGVYRQRQAPVYFKNSYFIFVVAVLAIIGSTANSKRAHDAGAYFIEQRDIVHDRTAKDLRKVKQEAMNSGSRQDRVDWFLRNRDATLGLPGSDLEALRQQKVDRLLPDRSTCNGEEIADRGG